MGSCLFFINQKIAKLRDDIGKEKALIASLQVTIEMDTLVLVSSQTSYLEVEACKSSVLSAKNDIKKCEIRIKKLEEKIALLEKKKHF